MLEETRIVQGILTTAAVMAAVWCVGVALWHIVRTGLRITNRHAEYRRDARFRAAGFTYYNR